MLDDAGLRRLARSLHFNRIEMIATMALGKRMDKAIDANGPPS
jgi:hypothetical protein